MTTIQVMQITLKETVNRVSEATITKKHKRMYLSRRAVKQKQRGMSTEKNNHGSKE